MARTGIYKSDVQKARDALVTQGKNPSIDAVRAELGHTGSKTTIHRYLRELEEEEGAAGAPKVAVGEAIQELVARLAARLHEEAEARIDAMRAEFAQRLAHGEEEIAALKKEGDSLNERLRSSETLLQAEQAAHEQTRQARQTVVLLNARFEQEVAGLKERLAENEAHRRSLEDKHRHTRESLEHYRESVKVQREQEQRRHEQQMQQLQAELRTLNQTLIVKQNELTHAYQDAARSGAELMATRKELHRSEQEAEKTGKVREELQTRLVRLEASLAMLTERLEQVSASRDELRLLLQNQAMLAAAAAAETAPCSDDANQDTGIDVSDDS